MSRYGPYLPANIKLLTPRVQDLAFWSLELRVLRYPKPLNL